MNDFAAGRERGTRRRREILDGLRAQHEAFRAHHDAHGQAHGDTHRAHHEAHHGGHGPHARGGFPFPPGFGPGVPPGFGPGFGPGFPPGFGPGFGRRGHRHDGPEGPGGEHGRGRGRRGNVRAAVLALLTERPMHGYEMIQELDARTGGVWRPSPGSVYPTLQLLEDEGLIASEESGGRKAYSLTDAGREEAAAAAANPPWAEFSSETITSGQNTREAIAGIAMALRQIAFEHNPDQWHRAVEVLAETKRKLYAILAETTE